MSRSVVVTGDPEFGPLFHLEYAIEQQMFHDALKAADEANPPPPELRMARARARGWLQEMATRSWERFVAEGMGMQYLAERCS